jgi:anhydro-N-acetylmuramic acid kinase
MDGVDSVLVEFTGQALSVLEHYSCPFSPELQQELLALNQATTNELHRSALAANQLARLYAKSVHELLAKQGLQTSNIQAIGVHGQTIRHRPKEFDGIGYTLQINNPALLASLTHIKVIADFRSRDVAAQGQGAPLVPAFHLAVFASSSQNIAVLNLGGISNISLLPANVANTQQPIVGFDCGPANALLDGWCLRHKGLTFDESGQWAAQGQVNPTLLNQLLAEPFFQLQPPKSTGRDLFNLDWLDQKLIGFEELAPQDVQSTLAQLTAQSIVDTLKQQNFKADQLLVCGGGAFNLDLMQRLQNLMAGTQVNDTSLADLPPMQVEAAAFAWLAKQHCESLPGNLVSATGAKGPRILGACYPA